MADNLSQVNSNYYHALLDPRRNVSVNPSVVGHATIFNEWYQLPSTPARNNLNSLIEFLPSNADDVKSKQFFDLFEISNEVITKMVNLDEAFGLLQNYDGTFTMKSKLYLEKIKKMLPPSSFPHGSSLGCLSLLAHQPLLPLSNFDRDLITKIQAVCNVTTSTYPPYVTHLLEKLLVSLVNKSMLLILLEYDVWAIRGLAKDSLTEFMIEVVFPASLKLRQDFQSFFRSFIDLRLRNFRDSMSRYYRDTSSKPKYTIGQEPNNFTPCNNHYSKTSTTPPDLASQDSSSSQGSCSSQESCSTLGLSSSELQEQLKSEEGSTAVAGVAMEEANRPKEYPPLYRSLRSNWLPSSATAEVPKNGDGDTHNKSRERDSPYENPKVSDESTSANSSRRSSH